MEYVVYDKTDMSIVGFGGSFREASLDALNRNFSSPRDFDCESESFDDLLDELDRTGADLCCAVGGWCVATQDNYRDAVRNS